MPFFIPTQTPKCPKCGRDEHKIDVCKHCGHKYEYEPMGKLFVFIVIFVIWLGITALCWIMDNAWSHYPARDGYSLIEIITIQFDFIITLTKNII